jgi:hypothetical protein
MKKRKAIHRRASNKKSVKARPAINKNALAVIPRRMLPGVAALDEAAIEENKTLAGGRE